MSNPRIRIEQLAPGDEIQCWMRLGLALGVAVKGDGSAYRFVPDKPRVARPEDLTRFSAYVVSNDPDTQLLIVHAARSSSYGGVGYHNDPSLMADITYSAFKRVRKLSPIHYSPRTDNLSFPANFKDAAFKPYRTLVEVILP